MKKSISLVIAISLLTSCLLVLTNCGPDPAPGKTESEKATEILTQSAWTMQGVKVDGTDQTSVYAGLKITFTPTGFTATNGGVVWPDSGSWQFTDKSGKTINRGDGLSITLTELTATKLVLTLSWTKKTLGGGRTSSVDGNHVFTFAK